MRTNNGLDSYSTYLYSERTWEQGRRARKYLISRLADSPEGAEFSKRNIFLQSVFKMPFVNSLVEYFGITYLAKKKEYDALMLEKYNRTIGHAGFQAHSDGWHVFSIEVNPEFRGRDLSRKMIEDLLEKARKKDVWSVRLGAGNNPITNRLYKKILEKSKELGVTGREKLWIDLVR